MFKFKINSQEDCKEAIREGGIAAIISMTLTFIFSLIGFFTKSSDTDINYFLDPWSMIDVILMIILIIFIFKKSRVATTFMFFYFLISKIIQWYSLSNLQGLFMALVFLFFYFNAMYASFIWHLKYKNNSGFLNNS